MNFALLRCAARGLLCCLPLVPLTACPDSAPDDPGAQLDLVATRDLATGYYDEDNFLRARAVLAPLVAGKHARVEDLVSAAIVERSESWNNAPQVRAFLERALALQPDDPAALYNLGILQKSFDTDYEAALVSFQRAHELVPLDYPTELVLANTLADLDRFEEAEPHYRALLAKGVDYGGSWYMTTLYRLQTLLSLAPGYGSEERKQERLALNSEYDRLFAQGITVPTEEEVERGNLGRLLAPQPVGAQFDALQPLPAYARVVLLEELAGQTGLLALDFSEEWVLEKDDQGQITRTSVGPTELACYGPRGLWMVHWEQDKYAARQLSAAPIEALWPLDLDRDGDQDLAVVQQGALSLWLRQPQGFEAANIPLPPLSSAPLDLEALDFDHEGDLDLLLVGEFGVRLWRADLEIARAPGAAPGTLDIRAGSFADATVEAGLSSGPLAWCIAEDFDTDQDVDLLAGGAGEARLWSNLRGGSFEALAGLPPPELQRCAKPLVADLDADARPDLWLAPSGQSPAQGWRNTPAPSFVALERGSSSLPAMASGSKLLCLDLDLDGSADALWLRQEGGMGGVRALGSQREQPFELLQAAVQPGALQLAVAQLEAGGALEIGCLRADGLELWRSAGPVGHALRLALHGIKDNRRGEGAIVELRFGRGYRRLYWDGEPQDLGCGSRERFEIVRVTWPNGVVENHALLASPGERLIEQNEGLVGSCPFLYTWDGTRFVFITDVLGITPLGLPMGPGLLVPPDHDEYVLVRGEQLAPKDGEYVLQFTEELREVTYLDRVRLDVVDHPANTSIQPNERFCFPPFPEAHLHTIEAPLAPLRATASDGGDWTLALAQEDDIYAAPFVPYRGAGLGQYLGLTEPYWIELAFDPAAVASAKHLRLLANGWFFWTDASVNMATARLPGIQFVPPILEVPDGQGGWRAAGPPVGFPAGKRKTMVLDLDGILDRADPRLRLSSSLRLYWDALQLAVDGDDAPRAIHSLEPRAAQLWERGFSARRLVPGTDELERFDWEELDAQPRWNQHPGLYTRLGECVALLGEVDDRFVIMGSGDALTLRFDASTLPPVPEGWRRDFLVFLDGWAKDRDPNTHEALYVEPLPFHGMSGYPYALTERFPDSPEHQDWRRTWNTRPGKRWILPLSLRGCPAVPR